MWHEWEMKERCTRSWWESLKEGDDLEDRGIDGITMDPRDSDCVGVEWVQLAQDRGW
jgi:hypothetical protein